MVACAVGDQAAGNLGAPCSADGDCASEVCIALPDGRRLCSLECDGVCAEPGYRCQLSTSGGYCVPDGPADAGAGAPLPAICARGDTRPCPCPAGDQGLQLCRADGGGWGACACNADAGRLPDPEPAPEPDPQPGPAPEPEPGPAPEPEPDPGPAPDPGQLPSQGFQSCTGILNCGQGCGQNDACYEQCFQSGTFTARAAYFNLARCANRARCNSEAACRAACGPQFSACDTDQPGGAAGCGGIFYCAEACFEEGAPPSCEQACTALGPPAAAQGYFALIDCLSRTRCASLEQCEAACGRELDTCLADP